jgi:hypothetical protein
MDQKIIVKQMIDFHKMTFQNSYNAMVMLQDQSEKMFDTFLSQANWMPQDFKSLMEEWVSTYKKGRDDFKKSVDENFKHAEEYFSGAGCRQAKARK